jgi:hypothetical protein
MALKLSTGLRNGMLNSTGFIEAFNDGIIYIYSGPQPANADAAITGTNLLKITVNNGAWSAGSATNGLGFDAPSNGTISKASAEVWRGLGINGGGTAGWFRLCGNPTDAGGSSTTLPRLDGTVAISGGDMNLSSITIVDNAPTTIDTFQFTLPSS